MHIHFHSHVSAAATTLLQEAQQQGQQKQQVPPHPQEDDFQQKGDDAAMHDTGAAEVVQVGSIMRLHQQHPAACTGNSIIDANQAVSVQDMYQDI
jgi:hypothetical protein